MVDYGYRSKCCLAAIRMGKKKLKKSNAQINVWICCACGTKDVAIITSAEAFSQRQEKNKSNEVIKNS